MEGGWWDIESPKSNRIEGREVSPPGEVSFDDADDIPLPPQIPVGQDDLFTFQEVGTYRVRKFGADYRIPVYEGELRFRNKKGKHQIFRMTDHFPDKPIYFTGCANGFYAHDPSMHMPNGDFFLVGIQPDSLSEHQEEINAVWHEIGHIILMYSDSDLALLQSGISLKAVYLPDYAGILKYAQALSRDIYPFRREDINVNNLNRPNMLEMIKKSYGIDFNLKLFHERFAWAAGMNLSNCLDLPIGFEHRYSVKEYAHMALQTYNMGYDREKERFTKGIRNF